NRTTSCNFFLVLGSDQRCVLLRQLAWAVTPPHSRLFNHGKGLAPSIATLSILGDLDLHYPVAFLSAKESEVVIALTIKEQNLISIFLDVPRIPQIRHDGALARSAFYTTVKL